MSAIATELIRLGACPSAVKWAGRRRSWRAAWDACPRGDWLLWAAGRAGADRRDLVRAAAACARLVLPMVPEGEERPRRAIEAAEAWADAEPGSAVQAAAAGAAWAAQAAQAAARAAAAWAAAAGVASGAAWAAAGEEVGAAWATWAAEAAGEATEEAAAAMHRRCAQAVRLCIKYPGPPGADDA